MGLFVPLPRPDQIHGRAALAARVGEEPASDSAKAFSTPHAFEMVLSQSTSERLKTQLDSLPLLFSGASPEAMRRRPSSGKWSAHENLAHLARYHEVFLERLRRMLTEDRPQLGRYRAENDPQAGPWMALPTDALLKEMKRLRGELIDAVEHLSPGEFERTGIHAVLGEMSIPTWIEFFLVHEAHHLYVALMRSRGGG
jgi:DinB superfamily